MEINLYDSCFGNDESMTSGQIPKNIKYLRGDDRRAKYSIYTNIDMFTQKIENPETSFGWLYESIEVMPDPFILVPNIINKFKYIFTYYEPLIKWRPDKFKWAPAAGYWIGGKSDGLGGGNIGIATKNKLASMICSGKTFTRGHKQRLRLAEYLKNSRSDVDIYGMGTRFPQVYDAIAPYMFHIVVENGNQPGYFTEKLLNCFAVGTIPIYQGCPNVDEYFNINGIISMQDYLEGKVILDKQTYDNMLIYRNINYNQSKQYAIPEDYIYDKYLKELT